MTSEEGGFFSAEDADSEGVEGKFYVWTPEEIRAVAGEEAARAFCAYYDVQPGGNWEGHSILHVSRPTEEVARDAGIPAGKLEALVAEAKPKLMKFRSGRVRPGLDDKVLTSWNGLMISALARGYQVLEEPRYLEAARKSARFVLRTLRSPGGGLLRTWRRGSAHLDACLDDYVFMAAACLDLYESDFDPEWVKECRTLMDRTLESFWDQEDGGFFFTPAGQKDLALRSKAGYDGAIPAGNSVAALVLFRLARLTGEESYADRAIAILRAYREPMEQMPAAFSALLWALDLYLDTVKEVALVGREAAESMQDFLRLVRQRFVPNRVVAFSPEDKIAQTAETVPLLAGKVALSGKPTAYLCEHFRCKAPTTDAEMFEKMLLGV
jgi:uncharacterized protein YyaL (SSP411 family)